MTICAVEILVRDYGGVCSEMLKLTLDEAKELHARLDGFLKLDHTPFDGCTPLLTVMFDRWPQPAFV